MKSPRLNLFLFIIVICVCSIALVSCKVDDFPTPTTETSETSIFKTTEPPSPEPSETTSPKRSVTPTYEPSGTASPEPTVSSPTETPETATPEPPETPTSDIKEPFNHAGVYVVGPTKTVDLLELSFNEMDYEGIDTYFSETDCYFQVEKEINNYKVINLPAQEYVFENNFHIFFNDCYNDHKDCESVDEPMKSFCNDYQCRFYLEKIPEPPHDNIKQINISDIQRIIVYAEIDPLFIEEDREFFGHSQLIFKFNCSHQSSDETNEEVDESIDNENNEREDEFPVTFYIGNLEDESRFVPSCEKCKTTIIGEKTNNKNKKMAYVLIIDLTTHEKINDKGELESVNWVYIYEHPLKDYNKDNSSEQELSSYDILTIAINKSQGKDYHPYGGTLKINDDLSCRLDPDNPAFILGGRGEEELGVNVFIKYLIFETSESVKNNYIFYEYPTNDLN